MTCVAYLTDLDGNVISHVTTAQVYCDEDKGVTYRDIDVQLLRDWDGGNAKVHLTRTDFYIIANTYLPPIKVAKHFSFFSERCSVVAPNPAMIIKPS